MSSVLWDPHLNSKGRSPLRLQTLLVQTGSRCNGAAAGSGFLYQWQENNKVEKQEENKTGNIKLKTL